MLVNSISNLNFNGHKSSIQPITPAHIAVVNSEVNRNYLEHLDSLGLINRTMFKKAQKAAAAETARETARNVETIGDILKHPRFAIEQADNGYWYKVEDPHNFRETMDCYAAGEKFSTPVFSREREYAKAIQNLAKNGSDRDFTALNNILNKALDADLFGKHEKMLATINQETPLKTCLRKEGTYGAIIPFDKYEISRFVTDKLVIPAKRLLEGRFVDVCKRIRK